MTNAANDRRIDYIEFPATDIPSTKAFYNQVFGWEFQDYGPDYISFHDGRIAGGFTTDSTVSPDGVLVVIYSTDLNGIESKIRTAGGSIVREQFDFPGGRRFHFSDPNGNILAVWSDGN
jgi:predicted enzyme related to lactoylglutathione lyase